MREIKFRGKSIKSNDWVKGSLFYDKDGRAFIAQTRVDKYVIESKNAEWWDMDEIEVDPATVGQFTGKHDVHNNEIYKDDILKYENPDYPNHKPYVIRWSEDDCCFECVNSDNFMLPVVWGEMKIIGNVFDNLVIINKCLILDIMVNLRRREME